MTTVRKDSNHMTTARRICGTTGVLPAATCCANSSLLLNLADLRRQTLLQMPHLTHEGSNMVLVPWCRKHAIEIFAPYTWWQKPLYPQKSMQLVDFKMVSRNLAPIILAGSKSSVVGPIFGNRQQIVKIEGGWNLVPCAAANHQPLLSFVSVTLTARSNLHPMNVKPASLTLFLQGIAGSSLSKLCLT